MKHKHYEMIVAFAGNTEFSVFCKGELGKEWIELSGCGMPCFVPESDYFLCLPQHKEACLHWLNGGDVQVQDFPTNDFNDYSDEKYEWSLETWWMSEQCNVRIKPKKEKRWIGIYNHNVTSQHFDSIETAKSFIRRRDEFKNCAPEAWQFKEIEVEV